MKSLIAATTAAMLALPAMGQADPCPQATALLHAGIHDGSALQEASKTESEMSSVQQMSYDELERFCKSNTWAADASYGLFDAGANAEQKTERAREVRSRLSIAMATKLKQELSKNYTEDKVSVAALQAYQFAIAKCADLEKSKQWGLHLNTVGKADGDLVHLEISWRSPDARSVEVEITSVDAVGGNLIGDGVAALKLSPLGAQPKTLVFARADRGEREACVLIRTKTAGDAYIGFDKFPPGDNRTADDRWKDQVIAAFQAGTTTVASQGQFTDRIRLMWRRYKSSEFDTCIGCRRVVTPPQEYAIRRLKPDGSEDRWFSIGNVLNWDDTDASLEPGRHYSYVIFAYRKVHCDAEREIFTKGGHVDGADKINQIILEGGTPIQGSKK